MRGQALQPNGVGNPVALNPQHQLNISNANVILNQPISIRIPDVKVLLDWEISLTCAVGIQSAGGDVTHMALTVYL